MKRGIFLISLDFELHWGVRDHRDLRTYGNNILGARKAIPEMLQLFKEYGIHATWATVGFLFFGRKQDLIAACPQRRPLYHKEALSPYAALDQIGSDEESDPFHFGKSLVDMIRSYPGQEIGTHTFSHYYCLEPGQDKECFRQDLLSAMKSARSQGISVESIVFPRNQTNAAYLEICRELGIRCYRGNERSWFYARGTTQDEPILARAARFIDSYLNISGHNTYSTAAHNGIGLVNLPASRFLRPHNSRLASLDPLKMRRIVRSLTHAAERGEAYHLWWHPHNFGGNLEENLTFIREVLNWFRKLKNEHGMLSMTMSEAALLARRTDG